MALLLIVRHPSSRRLQFDVADEAARQVDPHVRLACRHACRQRLGDLPLRAPRGVHVAGARYREAVPFQGAEPGDDGLLVAPLGDAVDDSGFHGTGL